MGKGDVQEGNQDDEEEGDRAHEGLQDPEKEEQNRELLLKPTRTQSLSSETESMIESLNG
jgi:hypothetical protein